MSENLAEITKDFRSRKAYEILYEKEDVTDVDISFLNFWFIDSPKILKLIKKKKFRKIKPTEFMA